MLLKNQRSEKREKMKSSTGKDQERDQLLNRIQFKSKRVVALENTVTQLKTTVKLNEIQNQKVQKLKDELNNLEIKRKTLEKEYKTKYLKLPIPN